MSSWIILGKSVFWGKANSTRNFFSDILVISGNLRFVSFVMNRLLKDYKQTVMRKTQEWNEYIDTIDKKYNELYRIYLKMPNEITETEYEIFIFVVPVILSFWKVSRQNFENIKVENAVEEYASWKKEAFVDWKTKIRKYPQQYNIWEDKSLRKN